MAVYASHLSGTRVSPPLAERTHLLAALAPSAAAAVAGWSGGPG